MKRSIFQKIALPGVLVAVFLAPLSANAQTSSGVVGWISHMLGWQTSLTSHISGLFEARKDNVESNGIARNQLLLWRRGIAQIDASSTNGSSSADIALASSTEGASDASSSPVFIPLGLFNEKKSSIYIQLLSAENSLRSNESQLSSLVSAKAANGKDMSAAQKALI